jgi:hypothetical protein
MPKIKSGVSHVSWFFFPGGTFGEPSSSLLRDENHYPIDLLRRSTVKSNSPILILVLAGVAGVLLVCGLVVAGVVAFFRVSRAAVITGAPPVVVEVGGLHEVTPAAEESPGSGAATPQPGGGMVAPPGFNAFLDRQLHLSLAYPAAWGEGQPDTRYNRIFYVKDVEPSGVGPVPKLYVTFIPLDDKLAEGSYSYMTLEAIRSFEALPVGSSQPLVPDAFPVEAFTYTRLPDQEVGGKPALVIENEGVWEAPEETTDRRVLIETEAGVVILGSIYATPEELALFEQAVGSFQYVP